jgi:hypothetical protein
VIDPKLAPGEVTILSGSLGDGTAGITTDGTWIWTANDGTPGYDTPEGSVSRIDPDTGAATTYMTGFDQPIGILFDGSNVWVSDIGDNKLKKLDSTGNILQSVAISGPSHPVFDGSNIWVPSIGKASVVVVRARDGQVLATLTGNGLSSPFVAAFDGQHILVTNHGNTFGGSLSLWNAANLKPIGSVATEGSAFPYGACSDGINFWITLSGVGQLARL